VLGTDTFGTYIIGPSNSSQAYAVMPEGNTNGRPPKHGVKMRRKQVYLLPSQIEYLYAISDSLAEGVRECIEAHREENMKSDSS